MSSGCLFEEVRGIGARLLWLHTYGERFVPEGTPKGFIPPGEAKCVKPVPATPEGYPDAFSYSEETRTLRVGAGEFKPVRPVVQSWLRYRMKRGAGRKSSPLDEIRPERWTFTKELLELLRPRKRSPGRGRFFNGWSKGPVSGPRSFPKRRKRCGNPRR